MRLHKTAALMTAATAIVGLTACQPAAPSAKELDAIKAVNGVWAQHFNAGDAGALTNLYWDDAVLMPPGAPSAKGHEAIRASFTREIESAKTAGLTMNIEHGPIRLTGKMAWQDGTFRVTDASGAAVDTGKYLSLLEQRDGTWRLLRDTWNSDGAAPAAAAGPDAIAVDPAHYKVAFENDKVRVLRINYGPKEKSVMHSHPAGVAIFMNDLRGQFTMPDGTTQKMEVKAGTVNWTDATTHNPENLGDKPFEVIQIELK
jgi:uncharacterized protein (TIGR02246 family)